MKQVFSRATALVLFFSLLAAPAFSAAPTSNFKSANIKTTGLVTAGSLTVTGVQTLTGNTTHTGNVTVGGTLGVTGATTLSSTLAVTGAVTLTAPLSAANIQTGSAKRELLIATLSPTTAAAADSTVYRFTLAPGRAGTVKRINFVCQVAPTVGTDTLKVLKNGSAGNTMLNAATFDANTLVANTASNATLTGTGADLALVATDSIYCEYSAGAQTVDAIGVSAVIEFEPTDF